MIASPFLSICIATYNRGSFIGETLESILGQLTPAVEVVVVDGDSPDNTAEVVGSLAEENSQLRYIRLGKKGGVDQDFCRAVEEARGQYCWLFSDDDLLLPGAVAAVLERLWEGYDLVVVNAEFRVFDLTAVLDKKRLWIEEDRVYRPDELGRLLTDCSYFLSFIGAVVIRRSLWLEREHTRYFGTEFVHIGVIFQAQLPGGALALATPQIVIRDGNAQWMPRAFEIWHIKWPRLIQSFENIPQETRNAAAPAEPWRNLIELMKARALGKYSRSDYDRFLRGRFGSRRKEWTAFLISCVPPVFFNSLLIGWFKAKKRGERSLYELRRSPHNFNQSISRWLSLGKAHF